MSTQNTNLPVVLVLMACYNGMRYIDEQIQSVAEQTGCDIKLLISVDKSIDNTYAHLQSLQKSFQFIELMSEGKQFGSASANFYYLILQANVEHVDFIAFCDQDDIWHPDKLSRHIAIARKYQADGVSSNVTAFWPNDEKKVIIKSQPQKKYDYLFESAGPGCTFLMTPWLIMQIKKILLENSLANTIALHDWLVYAVCRANNKTWVIDDVPSLLYRQHADNVVGANKGFSAFKTRFLKLRNGWYRAEVLKVATICNLIQPDISKDKLISALKENTFLSKLYLLFASINFRRRVIDRLFLKFCILTGLF